MESLIRLLILCSIALTWSIQSFGQLNDINQYPNSELKKYRFKVNLYNAILPGFGSNLVTQNNKSKFIAIGAYGAAGTGAVFLALANTGINNYENSKTYSEAEQNYKSTINQRNIGYGLLALGAGIWAFEMVRGNLLLNKKIKQIKSNSRNYFSLALYPSYQNNWGTQSLSPQLNFSVKASF